MKNFSINTFIRVLIFSWLLLAVSVSVSARDILVSGAVIDSISREPIPYVAVYIPSTKEGKLTDGQGKFSIWKNASADSLRFSVMGYTVKTVPLAAAAIGRELIVELAPTGIQLSEIVVKPKKEKYSKKNNPAVDLVTRIRNARENNDPRRA